MNKSSVFVGFISIAALLLPLSLFADHHEEEAKPPSLSDVWIVVPKAGMEAEFFAGIKADKELRAEKNDSRSWQVYTVVMGDDTARVGFRACCFNWADEDAYQKEETDKGFSAHWQENVEPYIDHFHRHYETADMEHSHWPDGKTNGPYYGVTTWTWKHGAGPESGIARKKMSKLAIDEGWASDDNNWLWLLRESGKPMTMVVSSFASFADMEPPEKTFFDFVNEKLGEEDAAALFRDFNSGYSDSDYTIWVRNVELSADIAEE